MQRIRLIKIKLNMKFRELKINGCYEIELDINSDNRGHFSRLFCENEFRKVGLNIQWKQINLSSSFYKGQIRGLHYYKKPHAEYKMIKCLKGEIYDVIVDLRENSNSYLSHEAIVLNEKQSNYLLIAPECAHGFQCLSPTVDIVYFHSNFFDPKFDNGINFKDPQISINWPLEPYNVSAKDLNLPNIQDL